MHNIALLSCLVCTAALAGTDSQPPAIAESSVRAHMDFLAGDALNGRGSGTRDEWIAATYLASRMLASGLKPLGDAGGFLQTVGIERDQVTGKPELLAGAQRLVHGEHMLVIDLGTATAAGALQKFKSGASIRPGAAVLMPAAANPENAGNLNAVSLVLWHENPELRRLWPTLSARTLNVGSTHLLGLATVAPVATPVQIVLSASAYDALASQEDGLPLRFTASTQTVTSRTWNAVGALPGADPARRAQVILLTAHLDHLGAVGQGDDRIYNGADDDASGTIAVLSLAESLSRLPRPKRSVVFAFFGSEAVGSIGARYFLAKATVPSARRGVIAQTVSSFGLHAQYHQPDDDIAHIDFQHMTESIQSMLAPVQWLADSDFQPQWLPGGRPTAER